jgi:anaerobic selenocysteine-containing dehydrogenase
MEFFQVEEAEERRGKKRRGKAGGYFTDYKMLFIAQCNYLVQFPNTNKIARAMKSLEFIVVEEQFMTPTSGSRRSNPRSGSPERRSCCG